MKTTSLLACALLLASCQSTKTAVNLEAVKAVKTVAVLPFEHTAGLDTQAAREAEAFFTATLMQNGFRVVERERMSALLKEQSLSASGLTSSETLKIGELSHADALLFGKVLKNQEGKKMVAETLSNDVTTNVERAFYHFKLSVRLVNSQTGETVLSQENSFGERVQDPKWSFPDSLSDWRNTILEGMGRDLKKAMTPKKK